MNERPSRKCPYCQSHLTTVIDMMPHLAIEVPWWGCVDCLSHFSFYDDDIEPLLAGGVRVGERVRQEVLIWRNTREAAALRKEFREKEASRTDLYDNPEGVIMCPNEECRSDDIGMIDHGLHDDYERRQRDLGNRNSFFNRKGTTKCVCMDCHCEFMRYGSPAELVRHQRTKKPIRRRRLAQQG